VSSDFLDQLGRGLRGWWRQESRQKGVVRASAVLVRELFAFLLDSTPERRRRRYGDMEYDWEHRVNTTSGAVGWRERLLGVFHSPYQPTDPALFRQMMAELPIDFREFIFVDLGSGKGRTLLLASEYAFRRIIGVEIVAELHRAAEENIRVYNSPTQRCRQIDSVCADAREFPLPEGPLVLYLFNPLPEDGLRRLLGNLERSLREQPRHVYVLYHNPLLEQHLMDCPGLKLSARVNDSVIYRSV
jgi:SAM-dependent methyltransferase